MMKLSILISILLLGFQTEAQEFGYFGKKNTLSVNAIGSMPLIARFVERNQGYYVNEGGALTVKNDMLDYGLVVSLTRLNSGKLAYGMEVSLYYSNVPGPTFQNVLFSDEYNGYQFYGTEPITHERLKIRTFTFMPKIEYTLLGEQLPFGINNQVGFGVGQSVIIEDNYLVENINYDTYYVVLQEYDAYDVEMKVYALSLMYAFNLRMPVSKSLMFNVGLRYNLNIPLASSFTEDFGLTSSGGGETLTTINRRRLSSISCLMFGLNYIF